MELDNSLITVEVAYATPEQQWVIPVIVPSHTSAATAIVQSGILSICPEIDLNHSSIGIFSQIVTLETPLRAGERVEIYRPLIRDPNSARLARAKLQPKKRR